jgi:hypothetical protein
LHTPASAQSRRGLDWMNFFIADVQTGFGSFVAFYLAKLGWSPTHIGLVLSVGGVAGMLSQIPGGCSCANALFLIDHSVSLQTPPLQTKAQTTGWFHIRVAEQLD